MKQIKHYSFDLWFTLIKSNPTFKKERAKYFFEHYNSLHKPIEEVEFIFRQVDLMSNATNEKTGKNLDADEMYAMVLYQLNDGLQSMQEVDLHAMYQKMDELIFDNSPTIFHDETFAVLDRIKNIAGVTLNLLSNTAFVKGATLRVILDNLKLSPYFDFQIYSDEVGVSKPNLAIFKIMLDNIYTVRKSKDISNLEILHVGDNPNADMKGALAAGMQALLINSNDKRITHLFD